ncbi:MAG: hypothetical protein IJ682_06940 [Lachnospiraceae bacterium]|nr:hypothetical protein [Lachnospiraceae bacterium]
MKLYSYGLSYNYDTQQIELSCHGSYTIPEQEYEPEFLHKILYQRIYLNNCGIEKDMIVSLNAKCTPSGLYHCQRGTQVYSLFDLRLTALYSLLSFRDMFVYAHHYPHDGSIMPMRDDDEMCRKLKSVYEPLSARLIDFLLVNANGYYSYMASGRLDAPSGFGIPSALPAGNHETHVMEGGDIWAA